MIVRGISEVQIADEEDIDVIELGGKPCVYSAEVSFEISPEDYVKFTKLLIGMFPDTFEYLFETVAKDRHILSKDCTTLAILLSDRRDPIQVLDQLDSATEFLWFYDKLLNCALMGSSNGFLVVEGK